MGINFFGVFEFRPLWSKQYLDDDYIGIKLILGLIGYIIGLWILPFALTINFGKEFLNYLGSETALLDIVVSPPVLLLSALVISLLSIVIIERISPVYEGYNIRHNLDLMISDLQDQMEEEGQSYNSTKLFVILTGPIFIGLVTGIGYSFVLVIAQFVVFFILILLLANFITNATLLILLAAVISWVSTAYFMIQRKLELHVQPVDKRETSVKQLITKRDLDMASSDVEPIVCDNCRSFIPGDSTSCPVCGEEIDNT